LASDPAGTVIGYRQATIMILQTLRTAFIHIALAAMVVRALIPVGWMPGTGPSHHAMLVVCSVDASGHMVMSAHPAPRNGDPAQDRHRQHEPCPYTMANFVVVPAVAGMMLPRLVVSAAIELERPRLLLVSAIRTPQNPRAPPRIV
jgi:Protein of unknown function (DUF2946)